MLPVEPLAPEATVPVAEECEEVVPAVVAVVVLLKLGRAGRLASAVLDSAALGEGLAETLDAGLPGTELGESRELEAANECGAVPAAPARPKVFRTA